MLMGFVNHVQATYPDTQITLCTPHDIASQRLRFPQIAFHITRSTFSFRALADGEDASILYICVPPMQLKVLRPYLRLLIEDALRDLTQEGGLQQGRSVRPYKRSTILALDEIASLRYMDQIEDSSGFLRGYGVMLWLMWQSVAQQTKYYTKNELISETMGVLLFGRPKTQDGAEAVSALLGEQTLEVKKHSRSGDRFSLLKGQTQEQADVLGRRVLTPFEVRSIAEDRLIGFVNGLSLNLRKTHYFKIPILKERSKYEPSKGSFKLIKRAPFLDSLDEALQKKQHHQAIAVCGETE